jgi:hypothetical protein
MKKSLVICAFAATSGAAFAQQSPLLNEFVFNHTGTDTNEFVEIFANPNQDLSGYRILGIEGDFSATGSPTGFLDNVITPGTANGDGYWYSFLNNILENGSITIFLVDGFSGTQGTDLDTNDDGVLDSTPWTSILDSFAIRDGGASDLVYSSVVLDSTNVGGGFTPGGASRIPNGTDTNSASDWMVNDFDGAGLPGFGGTPVVGEAYNTPGAVNQPVPEPATMAALGMGALALLRRRKK